MFSTDVINLNKSQMFEKIRATLPLVAEKTQHILECKDDLLYTWDRMDSCLVVINWRAAKLKGFINVKHQVLIPSNFQYFNVERVVASSEGSMIALAGQHGLTVIELPRRWGADGQFMEGKDTIACRSHNMDVHFFNNNPQTKILQVRWHPASPTDSHLLALLSDNTIRVYDNNILRHVWQIGPLPLVHMKTNITSSKLSLPHALGETSVDFDIVPANQVEFPKRTPSAPTVEHVLIQGNFLTHDWNRKLIHKKLEWPIIILRENGNIYILSAGIDTEKPRLQGPITIRPETIDNYGLDSCSILLIPSSPATVVIAESTGRLHHALLLESKQQKETLPECNLVIDPSQWTLEVVETVELELGITDTRNYTTSINSSPIHLKRDSINEMRYFAYHNTGLHAVTVNFIAELERYIDTDDTPVFSHQSHVEYIVCTNISAGAKMNAVLGFVLLQMPSAIVLLLSSGQVISLNLATDTKLLPVSTALIESRSITDIHNCSSMEKRSFIEHIRNIIKRNVTQPIISVHKSTQPTGQVSYELLIQSIEVLRTQYIHKHEQARWDFLQRLNILKLRKEQQMKDIDSLEIERDYIRENAHRLAERFEEISEMQEFLSKKCQHIIRQANTCLPSHAQAEKEFSEEVEIINRTIKNLENAPQKAKENNGKQNYHVQKHIDNLKNQASHIPEKHKTTIQEILIQMMREIEDQLKEVKRINNVLNL